MHKFKVLCFSSNYGNASTALLSTCDHQDDVRWWYTQCLLGLHYGRPTNTTKCIMMCDNDGDDDDQSHVYIADGFPCRVMFLMRAETRKCVCVWLMQCSQVPAEAQGVRNVYAYFIKHHWKNVLRGRTNLRTERS